MIADAEARRAYYREYNKQWHAKHAKRRSAEQYRRNMIIAKWFYEEIKPRYPCEHCGESDPIVIDFHHKDRSAKRSEVAQMARQGFSRATVLAEIEKCQALCANCHRREEHRLKQQRMAETGESEFLVED
jgi:hypothetical protein